MKKIYKILIIGVVLYFIVNVLMAIYQINQVLDGTVPFDYKKILAKNKDEYNINIDIECNRYFEREIGIIFNPEYKISSEILMNPDFDIFNVEYTIKQDGKIIKKGFSSEIARYGDVKEVVFIRYEPKGSFFCKTQNINIKIKKASKDIDFSKNELLFYISGVRSL